MKKRISLSDLSEVKKIFRSAKLHTVCESARCPNIGECFNKGTATFLIMGNICSRNCAFCSIEKGTPLPLDADEPLRVAEAVKKLEIKYAVITSVTRDDLPDGGAEHFKFTIEKVRELNSGIKVEVLVPDFKGDTKALGTVFNAKPSVFNHNIETVKRLYPIARPMANYELSLNVLNKAGKAGLTVKSGIMLGLGETEKEVKDTILDLKNSGCSIITIGQYLTPSKSSLKVEKYITDDKFAMYKKFAHSIGIEKCESSKYVRSSYKAEQVMGSSR